MDIEIPAERTSLRVLHCADLHIGRALHGKSLREDQDYILKQILELAAHKEADVLVVAGDLFDRSVPSAESVRLADAFLEKATVGMGLKVILIAGNHDSPDRLDFASELLSRQGLYITGSFDPSLRAIRIGNGRGSIEFYPVPYVEPSRVANHFGPLVAETHQGGWTAIMTVLRERWAGGTSSTTGAIAGSANAGGADALRRVLVAHLFVTGAEESESEFKVSVGGAEAVSADTFEGFDLVLLGHLHRPQSFLGSVFYSGSPLAYSLSEADHSKQVLFFDIALASGPFAVEDTPVALEAIDLDPLRKIHLVEGSLASILESTDLPQDGFVHVRLSDTLPVFDAFARIQEKIPGLIHVERRPTDRSIPELGRESRRKAMASSDFDLVMTFIRDMTGEEAPEVWKKMVTGLLETKAMEQRT